MSQQDHQGQETRQILSKILNYKENPETPEEEVIKSLLKKSGVKIEAQIIHGDVNVFDPNNVMEQVEKIRQKRRKLEDALQKHDIVTQEEQVKTLKRQIIKLKMEETELLKKQAKIKTKSIVEKVKKWEEIQDEIKQKKQKEDEARRKQQNEELLRQKKEEAKQQNEKRLEKKRQIAKKLKQIEQARLKREEIIKFAQNQYSKLNPKYLQIQKKFKQLEEQVIFEKDIYKKNHKLNQKIDHNAIKDHQKNYMTQLHERLQKRKSLRPIDDQFTTFIYRNEDKIAEEKEKLKRRRQFQNKLKEIHVDVDDEKKIKIEIARDKGKNPVKYHFLSQKALDDHQIYGQFQDFQIRTNPRQLGKEYLRQLPSITQNSRVKESQSLQTLSEREASVPNRYKDYLQELKSQRGPQSIATQEQLVSSMLRSNSENKSKILQKLDERSRKYELQLRKRKEEFEGYNNLRSSIKKSKEMDQAYVKSLKAKLACIEIKE